MTSSPIATVRVNSMPDTQLTARLKLDVAIYRAAQVIADVLAVLFGEPQRGLQAMDAEYRDRFREKVRELVDIYQAGTASIEPTPAPPAYTRTSEAQRLIERQKGRDAARDRGHEMGPYRMAVEDGGRDESACTHCGRSVFIDITKVPAFSGSAVDEGCIAEAGRG